jgi:hypothetical protein
MPALRQCNAAAAKRAGRGNNRLPLSLGSGNALLLLLLLLLGLSYLQGRGWSHLQVMEGAYP